MKNKMRWARARVRTLKVSSLKAIRLWGSSVGGRQENSPQTVHSDSQVLYTNTGWSVRMFRVGLHRVHGWAPFLFGAPLVGDAPSVGAVGVEPQLF